MKVDEGYRGFWSMTVTAQRYLARSKPINVRISRMTASPHNSDILWSMKAVYGASVLLWRHFYKKQKTFIRGVKDLSLLVAMILHLHYRNWTPTNSLWENASPSSVIRAKTRANTKSWTKTDEGRNEQRILYCVCYHRKDSNEECHVGRQFGVFNLASILGGLTPQISFWDLLFGHVSHANRREYARK